MAVSPQTLQAIKGQPLSAVIEATGGRLKRVGHEFLAQCLWHDDSNPSLTVSDDKGFCYCHVCRGGGDAIDYVSQRLGLSWREAAERAADILGVRFEVDDENPEETARRREARRSAVAALEAEQATYKANIRDPKAGRIRQVLLDRGLTREAAAEFGIGFAATGFFAGRITLPIYNHRGELVGFTGRATKPDQDAKYKNSADSDLFQKKQLVFNEVRAKEAAREAGSIVFVEGHLDVVSMWQAGIRNVVALQGTGAPDPLVLQRLTRSVKKVILCFDGDAGGRKAAEQFIAVAGPMAMAGDVAINVVTLPDGQDPDEVIRSGGSLYNYLASAPSWLDWVIDTWAAALDKDDTAAITDVERKLRTLIDGLRSRALRAHYIDRAARVLARTEKEAAKLAKEWGNREFFHADAPWRPRTAPETRLAAERRLLRLYTHRPDLRDTLEPLLERVTNPALLWLSKRLSELHDHSAVDLTPHTAMAVVAVAEPHYMQQLRTLIRPNVILDDSPGVISHLQHVILEAEVPLPTELDESDPD
jgi:DNA primase